MKRFILFAIIMSSLISLAHAKDNGNSVKIKIIQTSDVHGNFFPYDFINQKPWDGSLARVYSYVEKQRETYGENIILLDNGDILQGQPSVYYYNFIDTTSTHLCAEIMNFMGYDAGNMGNHDIETGHKVYDRWISQCNFPILGANVINNDTQEPYLPPYKVIERNGVKIAILGMVTPAIPAWLAENLWAGLHFDDMEECAAKWVKIIREKENPDILVGLFHSGRDASRKTGEWNENASLEVAKNIPGFDIILMGHDHQLFNQDVTDNNGHTVHTANPGGNANFLSDITITVTKGKKKNSKKQINIESNVVSLKDLQPSGAFMAHFGKQYVNIQKFVTQRIGSIAATIDSRQSFFGPSAFTDLIHSIQLGISGAEISFAAPLSFDATIKKGNIFMSDMFKLYKYENMLYVMMLTGQEIKDYLEFSYHLWTNQMSSPDDHLLLFKEQTSTGDKSRAMFANPSYNFDSAAGIIYTVDVTKPYGEKISIKGLANGAPFSLKQSYRVALNSYRGNGGGEHLTSGAGIPQDLLSTRIIYASDKDLRYYMMEYIRKQEFISPKILHHWQFVPHHWVDKAAQNDYKLLFP